MLATHLAMFAGLLDVLRDNGIIRRPQLQQLWNAAHAVSPEKHELLSEVRVQYVAVAKLLGIDLDLNEEMPGAS